MHLASPMAMAAGVKLGMRRGGVQTIAPQTILFDRDTCAERAALERVTMALLQFSPDVAAFEEAAAVLVDVSTTLRLFGGAHKLRQRMLATVRSMGFSAVAGCAPTDAGAWLLASSGGGIALSQPSLVRKLVDYNLRNGFSQTTAAAFSALGVSMPVFLGPASQVEKRRPVDHSGCPRVSQY